MRFNNNNEVIIGGVRYTQKNNGNCSMNNGYTATAIASTSNNISEEKARYKKIKNKNKYMKRSEPQLRKIMKIKIYFRTNKHSH